MPPEKPSFDSYCEAAKEYLSQREAWRKEKSRAERVLRGYTSVPKNKQDQIEFLSRVYQTDRAGLRIHGKRASEQSEIMIDSICKERFSYFCGIREQKQFDKSGVDTGLGSLTERMMMLVDSSGSDLAAWRNIYSSGYDQEDISAANELDSLLIQYELSRR